MQNPSLIVARASSGEYQPSCLRLVDCPIPVPGDGEVLIETKYLSLDPTNLNWLKLDPQLQFLPIGLGDPMMSIVIGRVVTSRDPRFADGEMVSGIAPWQKYAIANPAFLKKAVADSLMPLGEQLALLSHIGQAATTGLLGVGQLKSGDAVLISAAAGATGSVAAQVAKALGCYTVGIAGGAEKCRYLIDDLGLDAAIDYRSDDLAARIAELFPHGVDLFFDNVGGETLDIVLQNMAQFCRIAVCGAISQYDLNSSGSAYGIRHLPLLLFRQARMQGFIAGQFQDKNDEYDALLLDLYRSGRVKVRTHVVEGMAAIPEALTLLIHGQNTGKLMALV